VQLFDEAETTADLDVLLRKAGHDPSSPQIADVKRINSGYYAGRTAQVLSRVRDVLDRMTSSQH